LVHFLVCCPYLANVLSVSFFT